MFKKKIHMWLLSVLSITLSTNAQINYTFNSSTNTYAANASPTVLHAASVDDAISASTNIGFTFCYGGSNYTTFQASTNGVMFLGTTGAGSNLSNNLNTSSDRPAIAPLWDDLKTSSSGNVNYKLTGTSPNRVLTIEWKNMLWNYSAANAVISFQVQLAEGTNVIQFCYLQNSTAVNAGSASIGLSGPTSGDYYSLNGTGASPSASKVTETSNLSTKPASNQVYSWTPATCSGAPTGGSTLASPSSSCVAFNTTLTLSGATSACGITYQWQSAPASSGPWTNISGATSNSTVMSVSATSYYRCILACGGNTTASTAAGATVIPVGSCGICGVTSVASLPFSLTGQTTCGMGNDVTSSNVTSICGSSSYYGGEDVVYSFVPSATGAITVGVTSTGSYMGITLYSGCPISGGTCVGYAQSSAGNQTLCVGVTSGQTYYLVIDSWPSPTCNPFDVNISAPSGCIGSINSASAAASATSGCGSLNTTLSLSGYSGCGVSLQWQQSTTASTGPYTDISGATGSSYNVTTTNSTTYYQAVLTCGSSTAASTYVQVNVTQSGSTPCSLSTYTAATTTYSFESFSGTALPTTDDVLFNTIVPLGFQFCWGGGSYWGGYVASNSAFVFDAVPCFPNIQTSTYAAGGVWTGYTIPGPAPVLGTSVPRNAVLAPWHDILPNSTATVSTSKIQYITLGTAPNRRFIVSYENIPMFSSACETVVAQRFSGQIKLFETSNAIEIHIKNKQVCSTWNNGQAIMGLHNYDGTIYVPPVNATAHNATSTSPYNTWSMTNTAYSFQSPCAVNSGPCVVLPIAFRNFYGEQADQINKLYWETDVESNIKEFQIERSNDAINFKTIGYALPNNKPSKYTFDDISYTRGAINYYRITSVEFDGSRKSTYVYPIADKNGDLAITAIYPNPAKNSFKVGMDSKVSALVVINIYNSFGMLIKSINKPITTGLSETEISTTEMGPGVYVVEILNDKQILTKQKLVMVD